MSRLAHRRGRPSNYRKSLQKNETWEEVRYLVRNRDGHACVCCGKNYGFEVHHISYFVGGTTILGEELKHLEWLALVCEGCHQRIHSDQNHLLNPGNKNKVNIHDYKRTSRTN